MPEQVSTIKVPRWKTAWNIIKTILFIAVLVIILIVLSKLFTPNINTTSGGTLNAPSRGFYAEPKDTIDIIGLGDSTMTNGFAPMDLWKQYGYTGFNCGVGGQIIFDTFTTLSDALAQQKPKIVILDANDFFTRSGHMDTFYGFVNATMARFFPLIVYHNRWKIPQNSFKPSISAATSPDKGYAFNETVKPFTGNPATNKGNAVLDTLTTIQLDMINDLCKKNGAQLLIVYIPQALSWNQAKHTAIAQYASTRGINFLDLNVKNPGFSFDWKADTRDGGTHLNYWGAKDVTLYIGSYLHSHYTIPDHAKDPAYQEWNSDYTKYEKQVNSTQAK